MSDISRRKKITINDKVAIIKPLSISRQRALSKKGQEETLLIDAFEMGLESCTPPATEWPATLKCAVGKQVLEISGYDGFEKKFFDELTEYFGSVTGQAELKAVTALNFTLEYLHNCDPKYYYVYLKLAEILLNREETPTQDHVY